MIEVVEVVASAVDDEVSSGWVDPVLLGEVLSSGQAVMMNEETMMQLSRVDIVVVLPGNCALTRTCLRWSVA
jgi:hypothetical protein